ncbi:hypothetical protein ANO14919_052700 [Xylariales sp. No.14919]|nr:hypothetical protein ANO14919_052700 [Xylariales sp. No.14919]
MRPSTDKDSHRETGSDGIGIESVARLDTASEKQDSDKDVETARTGRHGQSTHIDEAVAARIAGNVEDFMKLVSEANEANERERGMTLRHAFKVYPKAIGWSMLLSSCLIMEGYQTAVVGSCKLMFLFLYPSEYLIPHRLYLFCFPFSRRPCVPSVQG